MVDPSYNSNVSPGWLSQLMSSTRYVLLLYLENHKQAKFRVLTIYQSEKILIFFS
jgi:hypothetical protein